MPKPGSVGQNLSSQGVEHYLSQDFLLEALTPVTQLEKEDKQQEDLARKSCTKVRPCGCSAPGGEGGGRAHAQNLLNHQIIYHGLGVGTPVIMV